MTVHDSLPQFLDAGYGCVLGEIILDGGDGGVFNVLRRVEVRLTSTEVDEICAFGAQLRRFVDHSQRGGELDATDAITYHLSSYCCCHRTSPFVINLFTSLPNACCRPRRRPLFAATFLLRAPAPARALIRQD